MTDHDFGQDHSSSALPSSGSIYSCEREANERWTESRDAPLPQQFTVAAAEMYLSRVQRVACLLATQLTVALGLVA